MAHIERDLRDHQVPILQPHRQGWQPLGQALDHNAQGPIQPDLKHLQDQRSTASLLSCVGWGLWNCSEGIWNISGCKLLTAGRGFCSALPPLLLPHTFLWSGNVCFWHSPEQQQQLLLFFSLQTGAICNLQSWQFGSLVQRPKWLVIRPEHYSSIITAVNLLTKFPPRIFQVLTRPYSRGMSSS